MVPSTILHIPHASTRVPASEREQFCISDRELAEELLRMTDHYTDELFQVEQSLAVPIVHDVSRLVCDPERFPEDTKEPMASRGMGAVYTRTSDGRPLREEPLSATERTRLLVDYYHPHHELLTRSVAAALEAHGLCLILDCHSFPSEPLPCDLDKSRPRPDICIGTDPDGHTPTWLRDLAVDAFAAEGWQVETDRPYGGTLVPTVYYRKDKRVLSVMVEVNRRLYMDEITGMKLSGFEQTVRRCQKAVTGLILDTKRRSSRQSL